MEWRDEEKVMRPVLDQQGKPVVFDLEKPEPGFLRLVGDALVWVPEDKIPLTTTPSIS